VNGPWVLSAARASRHQITLARGPPASLVSLGNEKDRVAAQATIHRCQTGHRPVVGLILTAVVSVRLNVDG
jgi:hypothetical protein